MKKPLVKEGLSKLSDLDSNQDKQSQNLLCYRYTIGQFLNCGRQSYKNYFLKPHF